MGSNPTGPALSLYVLFNDKIYNVTIFDLKLIDSPPPVPAASSRICSESEKRNDQELQLELERVSLQLNGSNKLQDKLSSWCRPKRSSINLGPRNFRRPGLLEVGEYYAYAKTEGPVMITTYSSATSHPELIERADAVVMDEIHHLGARTALLRLLPRLAEKEYVLGLSSVPEREDEAHRLFLKQFPICFDLGLGDALRAGIVSPLKIIPVPAEMTEKERGAYLMYTRKIQAAFKVCGPSITTWMQYYNPQTKQYVGRLGMAAIALRKKLLSRVEDKKERSWRFSTAIKTNA